MLDPDNFERDFRRARRLGLIVTVLVTLATVAAAIVIVIIAVT